jgi:predicted porin
MKRILYGTTALVAAGMMIGEAYAADGVKLGIGGRYYGAAGAVFGEDFAPNGSNENNLRSHAFKQDIEVHFKGEVTLDIGLTVGARVELEGQNTSNNIDASYAYISGGFGELRFGNTAEAAGTNCYLAPSAASMFGADSPNFNFSNAGVDGFTGTNGTCWGLDDKDMKAIYFSPNFGGFSFSASYTPDGKENTGNHTDGAGTSFDNNTSESSENFSVAGNFAHDFNGFNVVVGGGATFGNWETPNYGDPEFYNAFGQVSFSGFTLGASWGAGNDTNGGTSFTAAHSDYWVVAVGGTYNFDAWTVGLGWSHGEYEKGTTNTGDTEVGTLNIYMLTAGYALGPGIDIGAEVGYNDYSDNATVDTSNDYNSWEVGMGLHIGF